MMKIYIDGDACPVKDETVRVAARHNLQVVFVSNQGLRHNLGTHVQNIMVSDGFDAADNWITEHIDANDIVITADIPLASRCLKKGAHGINHTGKPFTQENIGTAVAMRDLHSYLRESGSITGGNAPFSKQDRSQFLQALDLTITKTLKSSQ
jgi:hypothetical protein